MDKAHPDGSPGIVVQQPIEGVVADEGPGGVGDPAGKSGGGDGVSHGGYGDGGKDPVGPAGEDGGLLGHVSCVVGLFCGGYIDGDALRGHGVPAGGQSDAEDHVRGIRPGGGQDGVGGDAEDGGDAQFGQAEAADCLREPGHGLPGGVDGLAPEGVEAGDEQVFHIDRSFQVCPYYHKAVQKTRKCTKGSSIFCGRIV